MGLAQILFNFRGRIKRGTWWLWSILAAIGFMVALVIVAMLTLGSDADQWEAQVLENELAAVAVLALVAIGTWITLALGAKRLHDRNRRGFWVAIPFVIAILISGLEEIGLGGTQGESSNSVLFLSFISVGFSLWLLIELGFLRGTHGPNRFGSDPQGAIQADAHFS
jgi:uncharacterized membrane protein YhaH (DUF805 family)